MVDVCLRLGLSRIRHTNFCRTSGSSSCLAVGGLPSEFESGNASCRVRVAQRRFNLCFDCNRVGCLESLSAASLRLSGFRTSYNPRVSTDFLERLASQLKVGKDASCRRAIQRILALLKKDYEAGRYQTTTEAENEFRRLVENDQACK
jgi:hypothetical protein